jgi:hypothetical protein
MPDDEVQIGIEAAAVARNLDQKFGQQLRADDGCNYQCQCPLNTSMKSQMELREKKAAVFFVH